MSSKKESLVVVAGDSGVYAGYMAGGAAAATADGRVVLRRARHLRRYTVEGGRGTGSASDLAALGLSLTSASISDVVPGDTTLLGVRRVFDVSPSVAASFGCGE